MIQSNKKISFLYQFIFLATLVLIFILILLGIIFNNYTSSKNSKETINALQKLQILDTRIDKVFQNSFNFINYDESVLSIKQMREIFAKLENLGVESKKAEEIFKKKLKQLNHFKSANSISVNSKLYLFELAKEYFNEIENKPNKSSLKNMKIMNSILRILATEYVLEKSTLNSLSLLIDEIKMMKITIF